MLVHLVQYCMLTPVCAAVCWGNECWCVCVFQDELDADCCEPASSAGSILSQYDAASASLASSSFVTTGAAYIETSLTSANTNTSTTQRSDDLLSVSAMSGGSQASSSLGGLNSTSLDSSINDSTVLDPLDTSSTTISDQTTGFSAAWCPLEPNIGAQATASNAPCTITSAQAAASNAPCTITSACATDSTVACTSGSSHVDHFSAIDCDSDDGGGLDVVWECWSPEQHGKAHTSPVMSRKKRKMSGVNPVIYDSEGSTAAAADNSDDDDDSVRNSWSGKRRRGIDSAAKKPTKISVQSHKQSTTGKLCVDEWNGEWPAFIAVIYYDRHHQNALVLWLDRSLRLQNC